MFCKPRQKMRSNGECCKTFLHINQAVTAMTATWGTGGREFKSRRSDQSCLGRRTLEYDLTDKCRELSPNRGDGLIGQAAATLG
jgi:hypothetical protein